MTVMLLQRSASPQLIHCQKKNNNISNDLPFLILIDIQEHIEFDQNSNANDTYTTTTIYNNQNSINKNYTNNNNLSCNNNIRKNKNHTDFSVRKIIRNNATDITSSNTCKLITSFASKKENKSWVRYLSFNCTRVSREESVATTVGDLAMRYYRLWIYACNIVLLTSAIGFVAAVACTLLFSNDPRRYLIPGVPRAYDPTALYAYFALTMQLGLVQLLGCFAARRLSTKLLNAYWLLLLALLFGDVVIGIAWVFRFERMRAELRPNLRLRLQVEYTKDTWFSEQWDQLQREFLCCGITGPLDFGSEWPESCCPVSVYKTSSATTIKSLINTNTEIVLADNISITNYSYKSDNETITISCEPCSNPYTLGCEDFLMHWLKKTADLLFVLGFCVIAFIKLCFLGILRYEIQEMIQKINLLKEPMVPNVPFLQTSLSPAPINQQQKQIQHISQRQFHHQLFDKSLPNGNILRRTTLPIVTTHTTNGSTSMYVQGDECISSKYPLLSNNLFDGGTDSDTNSHCALILEESTPPVLHLTTPFSDATKRMECRDLNKVAGNINNNLEMHEFSKRSFFSNFQTSSIPSSLITTKISSSMTSALQFRQT